MDIEHGYNFNDPLETTTIFRMQDQEGWKEFGGRFSFVWEDIKSLEEYPYIDDWLEYKGPKYWVELHDNPTPKLILGDYQNMFTYWRMFRNKYPIFGE